LSGGRSRQRRRYFVRRACQQPYGMVMTKRMTT
jgi:hypothetical protein